MKGSELIVPFCYIEGYHSIFKWEKLLSLADVCPKTCEDLTFAYILSSSLFTGG